MVQRYHHHHDHHDHPWRKSEGYLVDEEEDDEETQIHCLCCCCNKKNSYYNKKTTPKLLYLLLLCLLASCFCFILAYHLLASSSSSTSQLLYSFSGEDGSFSHSAEDLNHSLCSSVPNGTICCDRSSTRSDVCIMKGDVRTDSASSSVFLYENGGSDDDDRDEVIQREKIRPYTRKWETSVMNTIDELNLFVTKRESLSNRGRCDVKHDVPAVFFSTGGYTGNVYHEFNDGIIPLYITSQRFNKKVVFVILEYHNWWITKYGDILSRLTDYPPVDFSNDTRVHCFPEAIVGLRIHDELAVDPSLMEGEKSIRDFREVLDCAYWPRIRGLIEEEERKAELKRGAFSPSPSLSPVELKIQEKSDVKKPKLVVLSRTGSRAITNEGSLKRLAEEIGFQVEIFRPDRTTELAKIYHALNSSDVMIGVHGAAMTHFLFMKPGCVFIQAIPLGTDWAAETYYGEPAVRLGLKYSGYKILPRESSLYEEYEKNDPVLVDPSSVTKMGWEFTKKIYLDRQNVKLDLLRFRKHLLRAHSYTVSKNREYLHPETR